MSNQKGFTLIEMIIVLAVISTLLILLLPNLAEKNTTLQDKGCQALAQMAESQIQAYQIDFNVSPDSITTLVNNNYLKTDTCANESKKIQLSSIEGQLVEIVDNVKSE